MDESAKTEMDRSKSVVIVDDDADVCEALATLIEIDGYDSAFFTDGREALRYLRETDSPRLILVDANMPNVDGWQFLEQLREIAKVRVTPAFLISADTRLDERRARALGARGIVQKPFDADALSDIIRLHCAATGDGVLATASIDCGPEARRSSPDLEPATTPD